MRWSSYAALAVALVLVCVHTIDGVDVHVTRFHEKIRLMDFTTTTEVRKQAQAHAQVFAAATWTPGTITIGGSGALWCMDARRFSSIIGKPIPGDFDFVLFNPEQDENDATARKRIAQVYADTIERTFDKCKVAKAKDFPMKFSANIVVSDKGSKKECPLAWSDGFDMHMTHLSSKAGTGYCRCAQNQYCSGLHLTGLDAIKADYDSSSKSKSRGMKVSADLKKLELIAALAEAEGADPKCGPCTWVSSEGSSLSRSGSVDSTPSTPPVSRSSSQSDSPSLPPVSSSSSSLKEKQQSPVKSSKQEVVQEPKKLTRLPSSTRTPPNSRASSLSLEGSLDSPTPPNSRAPSLSLEGSQEDRQSVPESSSSSSSSGDSTARQNFGAQMQRFVKTLFQNKASFDNCDFFVEGTAVMYCMDKAHYTAKLKKDLPSDIDFGHFCRTSPIPKMAEVLETKLRPALSTKCEVVAGGMGFLRVRNCPDDIDNVMLDIHNHGEGDFKKVQELRSPVGVAYCLCNQDDAPAECKNVPLAPLDTLRQLYKGIPRTKDTGKVEWIEELMGEGLANPCGPCTPVQDPSFRPKKTPIKFGTQKKL